MEHTRDSKPEEGGPTGHEPEHQGPVWSHPYMIYIVLTAVLFAGLVFAGWLALQNGWLPSR